MVTVWHLKGPKAGTFEELDEDEAKALAKSGKLQITDGVNLLKTPENHPDYKPPRRNRRAKYPNKMLTTEA